MKICFAFRSDQLAGNSDWEYAENNPLGGSETALLRMASTFRELGHDVEVVNYEPDRVAFRRLMAAKQCDVFINLREPAGILLLEGPVGKVNYYWAQDDIDAPVLRPLGTEKWRAEFYARLNGLFLLSNYQRARWVSGLGLPLEKTHLITNPIPFDRFAPAQSQMRARGPRAFFASSPLRGLHYLLSGWPLVRRYVPNAEVHVFSSMAVNGLQEPEPAKALYARAAETPGVSYHGAVSQRVLREADPRG